MSLATKIVGKNLHPAYYSIAAVEAPVPWSPVASAADVCLTVAEPVHRPVSADKTAPEAAEFFLPGDFTPGLGSYDVCWCDPQKDETLVYGDVYYSFVWGDYVTEKMDLQLITMYSRDPNQTEVIISSYESLTLDNP